MSLLKDYNITKSLHTITTDNASNNLTLAQAVEDNPQFTFQSSIHLLGCMAHIINLASHDGLSVFGTMATTNEAEGSSNPLNITNLVDRPDGANINLKTVVACIHGLATNFQGSP